MATSRKIDFAADVNRDISLSRRSDGQIDSITDTLGTVTDFSYFPSGAEEGQIDSITVGFGLTDPIPRMTSFTYTSEGYVDEVIDPTNRSVGFQYDANGRLKFVDFIPIPLQPPTRTIAFDYGNAGNLISITPPNPSQPPHLFVYDERNRESTYGPPDAPGSCFPILRRRFSNTTGRAS